MSRNMTERAPNSVETCPDSDKMARRTRSKSGGTAPKLGRNTPTFGQNPARVGQNQYDVGVSHSKHGRDHPKVGRTGPLNRAERGGPERLQSRNRHKETRSATELSLQQQRLASRRWPSGSALSRTSRGWSSVCLQGPCSASRRARPAVAPPPPYITRSCPRAAGAERWPMGGAPRGDPPADSAGSLSLGPCATLAVRGARMNHVSRDLHRSGEIKQIKHILLVMGSCEN